MDAYEIVVHGVQRDRAGMMLKTLTDAGFVFRNRRGKYSFGVPLLDEFIVRQMALAANLPVPFGDSTAA